MIIGHTILTLFAIESSFFFNIVTSKSPHMAFEACLGAHLELRDVVPQRQAAGPRGDRAGAACGGDTGGGGADAGGDVPRGGLVPQPPAHHVPAEPCGFEDAAAVPADGFGLLGAHLRRLQLHGGRQAVEVDAYADGCFIAHVDVDIGSKLMMCRAS